MIVIRYKKVRKEYLHQGAKARVVLDDVSVNIEKENMSGLQENQVVESLLS